MGGLCSRQQPVDLDAEVSLFHFKLKDNIGEGAFGKVRIVRHRGTRELYALKYIEKQRCIRKHAVNNVLQERRILEDLNHPFIVNLRYAFQDDENCFYVLDLMLGGDLRFHLKLLKRFPEESVRLWTAELASAVSYLHDRRVVHRDIKPDNVLLDARGHAHLTDFNIAMRWDPARAMSGVAGSVAYMAPEVFARRGYGPEVDWWGLGVTMYELAFGVRPFNGVPAREDEDERSREKAFTATLDWGHASAAMPTGAESMLSHEGRTVLRRMLERDPHRRLGHAPMPRNEGDELLELQSMPWLADDWHKLDAKDEPAPFVPDPNRAFDPSHMLQEQLVTPKPLRARTWTTADDPSKLTPEMRALHERFRSFDFMRDSPTLARGDTFGSMSVSMASPISPGGASQESYLRPPSPVKPPRARIRQQPVMARPEDVSYL